ncbi:MAG TPA: ATP-dependent helicase, partial [Candidatus Nanoarchaeia archaeon]|nr:ATP-dependent helicase [Candidatus Nanoarchaeia archaeon]
MGEIHARKNILVSAPTGATKTLTAFLAVLNELVDSSEKGILQDKIYAVYISPLRALNNDIRANLIQPLNQMEEQAGKKLGIRVAARTGDTTTAERAKMLKHVPHILITTPESLAILLCSPKFRNHLKGVQWCIVDEVHALAENKRGVHLSLSLERLERISPGMTRVGLSATVAPIEEIAKFLVGRGRPCQIVDVQFLKELDLQVLSPVEDLAEMTHGQLHHRLYALIHRLVQQHRTTLIFTNTRAATERVVHYLKDKFPKEYTENIGAHHSSLSAKHRFSIEDGLRQGKLKVVVCSTSLELGIDIGFIDLVILLGSPKSVARALQRCGRAGHQLHSKTKGRIIVMDRDDLVECAVLVKSAIDKKIDRVHIPTNCLDVLAQQLFGLAIEETIGLEEAYALCRKSFCYQELTRGDFDEVIDYLAGKHISLEDRHIYAKIWVQDGRMGRRGKLGRVIYMTNIGTIPDETKVIVKQGEHVVGTIEEGFLEKLRRGDVFVLAGQTWQFLFARGMVAQVTDRRERAPNVPAWFSEMLPLSFDLAMEIGKFRHLLAEHVRKGNTMELLKFIREYLPVDEKAAAAIAVYAQEQYDYAGELPSDRKILIEQYVDDQGKKYAVFHTLFGRRVNDCLSRAMAFAISRTQHRDVEIGIHDNGFYVAAERTIDAKRALNLLKSKELRKVMEYAIEQTEVLKRRFRHCAGRALMILRNYRGQTKTVGRQQVSSMILLSAVRRISKDFCILKEAKREVLEDLMD